MPIANKIKSFLSSPKGKQAMERGRQELSKPQNQQKLKNVLSKVSKRK